MWAGVQEAAPFDLAARFASRDLLASHYLLRQEGFIRTKTVPHIFYLPRKHTRDTERLLGKTRDMIRDKVASLTAQLKRSSTLTEPRGTAEEKRARAGDPAPKSEP